MLRTALDFKESREGIAAVEFAIALPVLLIAFFGMVELSRYSQFRDKLESASVQVLDVINQSTDVSARGLTELQLEALPRFIVPFASREPSLVVTMVVRPSRPSKECKPVALWQYPENPPEASKMAPGGKGGLVNISQLPLMEDDYALAVEVYADYKPLLDIAFVADWFQGGGRNYAGTYGRPRYGMFGRDPSTGRAAADPPCKG